MLNTMGSGESKQEARREVKASEGKQSSPTVLCVSLVQSILYSINSIHSQQGSGSRLTITGIRAEISACYTVLQHSAL